MATENVQTFTDNNFEADVLKSGAPVLVDFWAEWCGPCKMIAPVLDELATEYGGRVKIGKVNIDEQPELATQYGVRAIPTLLLFHQGQVADRAVLSTGSATVRAAGRGAGRAMGAHGRLGPDPRETRSPGRTCWMGRPSLSRAP
jgi:thioredoxin 1